MRLVGCFAGRPGRLLLRKETIFHLYYIMSDLSIKTYRDVMVQQVSRRGLSMNLIHALSLERLY